MRSVRCLLWKPGGHARPLWAPRRCLCTVGASTFKGRNPRGRDPGRGLFSRAATTLVPRFSNVRPASCREPWAPLCSNTAAVGFEDRPPTARRLLSAFGRPCRDDRSRVVAMGLRPSVRPRGGARDALARAAAPAPSPNRRGPRRQQRRVACGRSDARCVALPPGARRVRRCSGPPGGPHRSGDPADSSRFARAGQSRGRPCVRARGATGPEGARAESGRRCRRRRGRRGCVRPRVPTKVR